MFSSILVCVDCALHYVYYVGAQRIEKACGSYGGDIHGDLFYMNRTTMNIAALFNNRF